MEHAQAFSRKGIYFRFLALPEDVSGEKPLSVVLRFAWQPGFCPLSDGKGRLRLGVSLLSGGRVFRSSFQGALPADCGIGSSVFCTNV